MIIKRALSLLITKRQGFSNIKTCGTTLFAANYTATHDGPTTVSRCIGRAPSCLLAVAFRQAAQRPVYNFRCGCLAPPGSSLDAEGKLLFPRQSVLLYVWCIIAWNCGCVKHRNTKVPEKNTIERTPTFVKTRRRFKNLRHGSTPKAFPEMEIMG